MKQKHLNRKNLMKSTTVMFIAITLILVSLISATHGYMLEDINVTNEEESALSFVNKENMRSDARSCRLAPNEEKLILSVDYAKESKRTVSLDDSDTFYGYMAFDPGEIIPEGPVYFESDDPGNISSLQPTTSDDFISAGTWSNYEIWYAVEDDIAPGCGSRLWTIDEVTGDMTLIGGGDAGDTDLCALAYDPVSGNLYGSSAKSLYIIDKFTGARTKVGDFHIPGHEIMIGLAFDGDGNLYGENFGAPDSLYLINTSTAEATLIGPLGIYLNFAQDMAYDIENDILYLAAYTMGKGRLYTCNTTTGRATLVGDFMREAEITGFAIPYVLDFPHNVGFKKIISPESGTGHIITPEVMIKNRGLNNEYSVPVNMKISYKNNGDWVEEYNQTVYIDIDSNEPLDVAFPDWTPLVWGTENIDVDYWVESEVLLNDDDPNDNYMAKEISLHFGYLHNIGVNEIISPASGRHETFTPEAVVENYGQNDETNVNISMKIDRAEFPAVLFEEDFESGIPGDWTVTDGYNDGATWRDDNPMGLVPPDGSNCDRTFAICDELYEETPMDEYLTSPVFSCVGATTVFLDFGSYFHSLSHYDQYAEVGVFDGTTWNNVYYFTGGDDYAQRYIDLSDYLAGKANAQIRFHFFSNDWAYFWMVDNVKVYSAIFVTEFNESIDIDINAAEIMNVPFSDWTPWMPPASTTEIDYRVTAGTQLSQGMVDGFPDNNCLMKWITLEHIHDVGVEDITEPSCSPDDFWLNFHTGYDNNAIGLTYGGTFEAAIRLTSDELGDYDNREMDCVKFYHDDDALHYINIKIYEEGTSIQPGALITSEPYTVIGKGWFEIELSNPVILDADEDVWVSVEIFHWSGQHPFGIDAGPAVDGKGGWIYLEGDWYDLQHLGFDNNWCIEARVREYKFLPGTYPVESVVVNYGTYNESNFNVNATIYEGDELFYHDDSMVTTIVEPGDNVTVEFDNVTFEEEDEGYYRLEITTELVGDDVPFNDPEKFIFIVSIPDIWPPVTTHEFDGTVGDNNWYTSDIITIILTAEDYSPPSEPSGVEFTYYKLDEGEYEEYDDDNPPVVSEDGSHKLWYYSVDFADNNETKKGPFDFKIDQTVPTIELTWNKEDSKLVADVYDETSGVAKVEFYVNGELLGEVTGSPYEWEVTNPKKGDKGQAIVYDNAGNLEVSPEIDAVSQSQSQSSSSPLRPLSLGYGETGMLGIKQNLNYVGATPHISIFC